MKVDIKRRLVDWILKNSTFPIRCESGNELTWMLKDNCPVCLTDPIETLSNADYHTKYPACNRIQIGTVTLYLCDHHLKELRKAIDAFDT